MRRGPGRVGEGLFRLALCLLPPDLRRTCGPAMEAAFRDRIADVRARGGHPAPVILAEVVDVLAVSIRARLGGAAPAGPVTRRRRLLPDLAGDLRAAVRTLRRRPGYLVLASGTLALGVGACTAMFAVVNGVLLRPLAYPDPGRLTMVFQTLPELGWEMGPLSFQVFDALDRDADAFQSMGALTGLETVLLGRGDPRRVQGQRVTGGLFATLGIEPVLGRWILPSDDVPGAAPVAVLSHDLWTTVFGADPKAVGSTVRLGETDHLVVGVMPRDFPSPGEGDELWTATAALRADPDHVNLLQGIGRLAPGQTVASARAQVDAVAGRVTPGGEADAVPRRAFLLPRLDYVVGGVRRQLWLLTGAVGLLLCVACANVAGLTLARGSRRRQELAVRRALGAGRARLIRTLLAESLVVATVGAGLGVAVAAALIGGIARLLPGDLPRLDGLSLDPASLAFVGMASLLSALVFGGLPALRSSRSTPGAGLRTAGRGGGSLRAQVVLAGAQVAVAAVLLVGASLLARSLLQLQSVDPGFEIEDRLTALIPVPPGAPEEQRAFLEDLHARMAAYPGVQAVGLSWGFPFAGGEATTRAMPEGASLPPSERPSIYVTPVSPGFFEAMGMPLLQGTGLDGVAPEDPPVAVVNQALADALWPGEDAVGKAVLRGGDDEPTLTRVVGVVPTIRTSALSEEPKPYLYQSLAQALWADRLFVVIHTDRDPLALAPVLRSAVAELDPGTPVDRIATLEGRVASSLARPRFRTAVAGVFSILGAVLAVVGVYGVMALLVAGRTREIGVRMAMGAPGERIRREVLREGLAVAGTGLAMGLVTAGLTTGVMESFLFGVPRLDPITYGGVAAVILAAVVLAVLPSARRASAVDPLEALRAE